MSVRSQDEIEKKIKEICEDDENFTFDNMGSLAQMEGEYQIYYSQSKAETTMRNFTKWLFTKEIKK